MPKVSTYNIAGAQTGEMELNDSVFGVEVNEAVMRQAVLRQLANERLGTHATKTRGLVRGGGRKPWKQKGTGRARFGSTRNPIWRHGGIVFGPRGNENYSKKLSKTSKHVALRQALTLANQDKKILVSDIKTTGKTAEVAKFLAAKKCSEKDRVLLVVDEKTPELMRATNNLANALLVRAQYLSVYYILNADKIVITPAAVKAVEAWLAKEAK